MASRDLEMNIKLVSQDGGLYKLCREILAEVSGRRWTLTAVSAEVVEADGDLYIWDFRPEIFVSEQIQRTSAKHVFLVHRDDLQNFRVEMGSAGPLILLKPVTRA